jgi:acyl-CoA dehydrogenase
VWTGIVIIVVFGAVLLLLSMQTAITIWTISYTLTVLSLLKFASLHHESLWFLGIIFVALVIGSIKPLRQQLVSRYLFGYP